MWGGEMVWVRCSARTHLCSLSGEHEDAELLHSVHTSVDAVRMS
jgi:hypothetical protein